MSFDESLNRFNRSCQVIGRDRHSTFISKAWANSVLVIVNLRLGIDKINDAYFPVIKRYMKIHQFVGLIGGQPNKAFYFVGLKDDKD
jgi:cysteine protease ATG4